MKLIKRVANGFKGFGSALAAIPRDIKRYRALKRM